MTKPLTSSAIALKTKSPQSAQKTSIVSKSLKSGKVLSLTDMHRQAWIENKSNVKSFQIKVLSK